MCGDVGTDDGWPPATERPGVASRGSQLADNDSSFATRMADAARDMQGQRDALATMEAAVRLALTHVEGADAAALSIVRRRTVETSASTGTMAAEADRLQYKYGEGPCLDTIREHHTVYSPSLGYDRRWPTWGPQVVERAGAHSALSFLLFTDEEEMGALNLYAGAKDAFTDASRAEGAALASHIAIAIASARGIDSLVAGLDTRSIIGQAIGIVMERFDMPADTAFTLLTRLSTTSNTKLHEVASAVVAGEKLPDLPDS